MTHQMVCVLVLTFTHEFTPNVIRANQFVFAVVVFFNSLFDRIMLKCTHAHNLFPAEIKTHSCVVRHERDSHKHTFVLYMT